ncbi:MAG: transcriptional regulator NrdR [candidate division KSB1 bacterium]|nr:transcriptional regulator NrdR [candidate division KSB1 bacterium]
MRCPFCNYHDTKVIDSRTRDEGRSIRRRRRCLKCNRRFTTRETVDEIPLRIVKQDGTREEFNREKLLRGIQNACTKRPISTLDIEELVSKIEFEIRDQNTEEVSSRVIGEQVMKALKKLDDVAYVRFASVYRNFQAKEEFLSELDQL